MKNLNLILILFCGALLLFTFQNCQKASTQIEVQDENSVLMIGLPQYKYKSVVLRASPGFQTCESSCITSSVVQLNLVNKSLLVEINKTDSNETLQIGIPLRNEAVAKLHSALNLIKINEFQMPSCSDSPCPVSVDSQSVVHTYTDFNDRSLDVYYPNFVDGSIQDVTIGKYDLSVNPAAFICAVLSEIKTSTALSAEARTEAVAAVVLNSLTELNHANCN